MPQKKGILQQGPPRIEEFRASEDGELHVVWAVPHGQLHGVVHLQASWQLELFLAGAGAQMVKLEWNLTYWTARTGREEAHVLHRGDEICDRHALQRLGAERATTQRKSATTALGGMGQ